MTFFAGLRFTGMTAPWVPRRYLGFSAAKPCICQADAGIGPDQEQLLLACEAVLELPQLRAVGADEDVEPLTIGKLVILAWCV